MPRKTMKSVFLLAGLIAKIDEFKEKTGVGYSSMLAVIKTALPDLFGRRGWQPLEHEEIAVLETGGKV